MKSVPFSEREIKRGVGVRGLMVKVDVFGPYSVGGASMKRGAGGERRHLSLQSQKVVWRRARPTGRMGELHIRISHGYRIENAPW